MPKAAPEPAPLRQRKDVEQCGHQKIFHRRNQIQEPMSLIPRVPPIEDHLPRHRHRHAPPNAPGQCIQNERNVVRRHVIRHDQQRRGRPLRECSSPGFSLPVWQESEPAASQCIREIHFESPASPGSTASADSNVRALSSCRTSRRARLRNQLPYVFGRLYLLESRIVERHSKLLLQLRLQLHASEAIQIQLAARAFQGPANRPRRLRSSVPLPAAALSR